MNGNLREMEEKKQGMVRSIGLEPTTPTMSRWCSNQLSYERIKIPRCLFDSGTNSSEQGENWQEEKCNFVLLPVRLLGLYPFRRFFRRYPYSGLGINWVKRYLASGAR